MRSAFTLVFPRRYILLCAMAGACSAQQAASTSPCPSAGDTPVYVPVYSRVGVYPDPGEPPRNPAHDDPGNEPDERASPTRSARESFTSQSLAELTQALNAVDFDMEAKTSQTEGAQRASPHEVASSGGGVWISSHGLPEQALDKGLSAPLADAAPRGRILTPERRTSH